MPLQKDCKSVCILTEIVSPYRIPVFNVLSQTPDIDLEVLFFSKSEERRSWSISWEKIKFKYKILFGFLFSRRYQDGPIFFNPTIIYYLFRNRYHSVICFGYHHPTIWLTLLLNYIIGSRMLLWSESTIKDHRDTNKIVQFFKRLLISRFDGFIAAGRSQVEYLEHLGARRDQIWIAPDSVDSDFFISESELYRNKKNLIKSDLGIQGPIILYVGRLIDDKGIPELIDAFEQVFSEENVTLILVGDGPDFGKYRDYCKENDISAIQFKGFCLQKHLPRYYAISDFFVFPTRSDPWGLVINEAMCAGLPIVCSTAAGASADLVIHGENGLLHEPGEVSVLRNHMLTLLRDENMRLSMGIKSKEIIAGFHPNIMAQGMLESILQLENKVHSG